MELSLKKVEESWRWSWRLKELLKKRQENVGWRNSSLAPFPYKPRWLSDNTRNQWAIHCEQDNTEVADQWRERSIDALFGYRSFNSIDPVFGKQWLPALRTMEKWRNNRNIFISFSLSLLSTRRAEDLFLYAASKLCLESCRSASYHVTSKNFGARAVRVDSPVLLHCPRRWRKSHPKSKS